MPGNIDLSGALATFLAAFVVGGIFARNREKIEIEKIKTLKSIGSSIAHELRTPLRTMSANALGIKNHLPLLLESYQLAKDNNIKLPFIDPLHYDTLKNSCETIESEAQYAFTFIDMLLVKAEQTAINGGKYMCSMHECINQALSRYPFDLEERKLVVWHSEKNQDFLFKGDELLVIHILFNLLKNALYYVKAANKGNITIWLECNDKTNTLHFKDTGQGISQKKLPHIFDRFFSKTRHGTGIGLHFCKLAMEAMRGKIKCYSEEGEYAEFLLMFPIQDSNKH